MDDLEALAGRWGVERGYHEIFGRWHVATDDTVRETAGYVFARDQSDL